MRQPSSAPRMTRADALKEARRRWGPDANAGYNPVTNRYWVVPSCYGEVAMHGYGHSWEAAFADADAQEKGDGNA